MSEVDNTNRPDEQPQQSENFGEQCVCSDESTGYVKKLAEKIYDYFNQTGRPLLSPELTERFPAFAGVIADLHSGKILPRTSAVASICSSLMKSPEPSKLQQALAYLVNYVPSRWLLEQEYAVIRERREIYAIKCTPWNEDEESIYQWASKNSLSGLCMSGGGIRSATFNLGILQGMASKKWIGSFDYFSSVSGGGYIHSWFAAWLKRTFKRCQEVTGATDRDTLMRQALSQVEADLTPLPIQPTKSSQRRPSFRGVRVGAALPGADYADGQNNLFWPPEIKWLRSYSNYLTPKTGLFTMDTWSAFSVWLRNTFLNQLVLIAMLIAGLSLLHLLSDHWRAPAATQATEPEQPLALKGTASTTGIGQLSSFSFSLSSQAETPDSARLTWHRFTYDYAGTLRGALPERWRPKAPPPCPPLDPLKIEASQCPCAQDSFAQPIVSPRWTFLGLYVVAVIAFLIGAWLFGATLSAEWSRIHERELPEGSASTAQPLQESPGLKGPVAPKRTSAIKLLVAVVLLTLSGVPFFYWILYNDSLDWWTPLVIFALFTCLGLFGAFGARLIDDLKVYGMEEKPSARSKQTPSNSEAHSTGNLPLEEMKRDQQSVEKGEHWKGMTSRTLLKAWLIVSSIFAGVLGSLVFVAVAGLIKTAQSEQWGLGVIQHAVPAVEVVFGIPLLMGLPFFTVILLAGLIGHFFEDWMLEIVARARARSILLAGGAFGVLFVAFIFPGLSALALGGVKVKVSAAIVWIATTLGGVFSGKSDKTDGNPASPSQKRGKASVTPELLATVGPYVYVIGLLIALSALVQACLGDCGEWSKFLITFAAFTVITLCFGWQLDATKFSMYPFYRDRLTRCYLGASNRERKPSPLTGFDNRDTQGMQLRNFTPKEGYGGPVPIFCATLNLTTGGDLATQERKGASFALTPLYSGYTVSWTEGREDTNFNGFVPTSEYAVPGGLNIAAAMAISGAAISPNWGFHSKPATAFLLTMFNARLGRWLPNPRKPSATRPQSIWRGFPGMGQLLSELFGQSDDSSEFVYLSDGGHFDNMGLYELVRRHCHRIIICDAEEDSGYVFSGIGMAIRKCRIDFGVEIDLDLSDLRLVAKTRFSTAHIVRGFITYPDTPGVRGEILYIKSSLVSFPSKLTPAGKKVDPGDLPDVPGDVQNYWLEHDTFPHDSTVNQWFTESQFESYRRLGQRVIESITWSLL